ncbi:MAG: LysR family transcriptional regulator [Lachnospiraceae bacterium]|nr:LysR family transcriptional regulator [Lachnospiraceae bacterium]
MNQNQLEYFVAAAETLSFTKAAERFFVSQTAISQQIGLLEQSLGAQLFDRSTRPVTLTSAGQTFLIEARAILERMQRSVDLVHEASVGLTGTLRIGYVSGYERSDLSVWVRYFHRENPNLLITFYRSSTDILAAGLLSGETDIIFTWDSTNIRQTSDIEHRMVEKAKLVVALYNRHPLAQRLSISRQELLNENIIYMSPSAVMDSYGDALFMEKYTAAGYRPNIIFRSSDTESVLMMVASEEGVSILPDYCTTKLANADNLTFVPLAGEDEVEEVIAAWSVANHNPALRRFIEFMEEMRARGEV